VQELPIFGGAPGLIAALLGRCAPCVGRGALAWTYSFKYAPRFNREPDVPSLTQHHIARALAWRAAGRVRQGPPPRAKSWWAAGP